MKRKQKKGQVWSSCTQVWSSFGQVQSWFFEPKNCSFLKGGKL